MTHDSVSPLLHSRDALSLPRASRSAAAFVAGLLAITPLASLAGEPMGPGVDPLVPDEAIVRLAPATTIEMLLDALEPTLPGTTVAGAIESRGIYRLILPADIAPVFAESALEAQVDSNLLLWGELSYEGQAAEGKTGSLWVSELWLGPSHVETQYGVDLLGLADAHARSTGQGVIVAVLDTGVDAAHPMLAGKVLPGQSFITGSILDASGACLDPSTQDVGDCLDNDGDGLVDEMVGHGTFVAGLVTLVAPESKILPVVVLNSDGIGDSFSIAQGLFHALDHGAKVINCSFGSTYKMEAMEDALDEAKFRGVLVVGAAGNFDRVKPEEYPALIDEGIAIAATDDLDLKASFSNFHPEMALSAPGESSLLPGGELDPERIVVSALPGGTYGAWAGTSFANAWVSGTAALIRAQHPLWPESTSTWNSVVSRLKNSAVDIDALNPPYAGELGAGRLDAAAATALGPVAPAAGDLDADGVVDGADLGALLAQWGPCETPGSCIADLDLDGTIDGADLGVLLANWTV